MPKVHGTPDRETRRRIGRVIRSEGNRLLDARGLFRQGFCCLVDRAHGNGLLTQPEADAFTRAIEAALGAQPYTEAYSGSCYIPSAMLGVYRASLNNKRQAAIRASWLRHWEETGVALDYYEWQDRAMRRAEQVGERRAAALAKKQTIASPKGGRFILAA